LAILVSEGQVTLLPSSSKKLLAWISDTIAGINQLFIDGFTTIMPQHKAGKMRILACLGEKRSRIGPEFMTSAEAGYPGFTSGSFHLIMAPAKTPRNVLSILEKATSRIMSDENFQKEMLTTFFIDPVTESTHEATRQFILTERAKWTPIIKATGVKLQ
jgi:tripartite-type tricarboxylate transporter receptor subunit TctC